MVTLSRPARPSTPSTAPSRTPGFCAGGTPGPQLRTISAAASSRRRRSSPIAAAGTNPKFDINANGNQVLFIRNDRMIVRADFDLTIRGPLSAGGVAGNVGLVDSRFFQDIDILPNGKIVVAASGYLGGSGAFTDLCVGNVIRFAGVSLREAVDMAGARPRELLGLPARPLAAGAPAHAGQSPCDWPPPSRR